MPHFIAYAWFTTIAVTIAAAAGRGMPTINAFDRIYSRRGFYFSMGVMVVACGLAVMQLSTDALLLGQPPMTWAALVFLLYTWICIIYQLRRPQAQD